MWPQPCGPGPCVPPMMEGPGLVPLGSSWFFCWGRQCVCDAFSPTALALGSSAIVKVLRRSFQQMAFASRKVLGRRGAANA